MGSALIPGAELQTPDSMIFDPFEINEIEDENNWIPWWTRPRQKLFQPILTSVKQEQQLLYRRFF